MYFKRLFPLLLIFLILMNTVVISEVELLISDFQPVVQQKGISNDTETKENNATSVFRKSVEDVEDKDKNKDNIELESIINEIDFRFDEPEAFIVSENNLLSSEIDNIKNIKAEIFIDKKITGNGFFRILLTADSYNLKDNHIKNDLLFLINTSASTTNTQLEETATGIISALKHTELYNRFNIIEFKNVPYPLFSSFKKPDKENLREAENFLVNMNNTGPERIKDLFSKYIKNLKIGNMDNIILYLISDVKINTSHLKEVVALIKEISVSTNERIKLFTYSNNKNPNELLLNIIANQNNGLSKMTKKEENSGKALSDFIINTNKSVCKNILYQISDEVVRYTYPRALTGLYFNCPVNIYGYFHNGTNNISLKVKIVNEKGREEEVVYNFNLDEASKNDRNISKKWAVNYLYFLIKLLGENYSSELYNIISNISGKFEIPFPYYDE